MAQKIITLLTDDIDGSDASETVQFALDGNEYQIDLNEAHVKELRDSLSRFTNAARKTSGARRPARKSSSNSGVDSKAVRLWAIDQGMQVNTRGRIQSDIVEKYQAAQS